ncbi:MAG TPA: ceramide glucosyltransferase [Candidatus Kryptonia bacterium]
MKEIMELVLSVGIAYYLITLIATYVKILTARVGSKVKATRTEFLPPITILKPVTGVDGNLRENLLSFINQDYPEFEIVVGIQSPDDPAIQLIHELIEEFPESKIELVVSDRTLGFNPKINNLYGMMPHASYDYMVISDSNVIVRDDYLRTNIQHFQDKNVGLVTNLIRGVGGENIGALFENLHLNSFVIGNVSLLALASRQVVVGKSIFFRKSQFDTLGGIWELRNYLAEDYLMGRIYKKNGYKVVVSPNVITTTNHSWNMKRFLNRHTRWAQLRWNLNKLAYIGELLANFSLWSLAYMIFSGFSYEASVIAGLCWLVKITGDSLMNYTLNTGLGFRHCVAAPFKDIVIGMTWPVPLVNRKTKWRGNPVKITRNTLLLPTE